jgi:hypothetical protein
MAKEESNMEEGEVLFGMLGHFFWWSHRHGFTWALNLDSLMLAPEMPTLTIAFKKKTLDMSEATGNVILRWR